MTARNRFCRRDGQSVGRTADQPQSAVDITQNPCQAENPYGCVVGPSEEANATCVCYLYRFPVHLEHE